MYVKVVFEETSALYGFPGNAVGAGFNVEYGNRFVYDHLDTSIDWNGLIPPHFEFLHVLVDFVNPTGTHDKSPYWTLRWAVWGNPDLNLRTGVVTTGDLYILGENGKTVDRVR